MKVYEITLTPQQLATITLALEEAAEHAGDAAKDDPTNEATHRAAADRYESLWRQMSEVARDFTLVDR